jgi:hypothetical protein
MKDARSDSNHHLLQIACEEYQKHPYITPVSKIIILPPAAVVLEVSLAFCTPNHQT